MWDDIVGFFTEVTLWILGIAVVLAAIFTAAIAIGALVTWSPPWSWVNQPHYPYPRQATNITYVHAGGIDVGARIKILDLQKVAPTNWATPTCPSGDGDLFNPSGSTSSQFGGGWAITFLVNNAQQTLNLPDVKVHRVVYGGKQLRVQFVYNKVVFYYDQLYDSLWTNTGSDGPKQHVIDCMLGNSLAQRMLVGLKYVTIFEPVGSMK